MAKTESPSPETSRNTIRISNDSIRQENDGVNREKFAVHPERYDSMENVPEDDYRPLQTGQELYGEKVAAQPAVQTERDGTAEAGTESEAADPVESLPTKAKEYLKRVERALTGEISYALSVERPVKNGVSFN